MKKSDLKPGTVIGVPKEKDPTYDMLIISNHDDTTVYIDLGRRAGSGGPIKTGEILDSSMVVKRGYSAIITIFEKAALVNLKLMADAINKWME
jgi:hypothetical protein